MNERSVVVDVFADLPPGHAVTPHLEGNPSDADRRERTQRHIGGNERHEHHRAGQPTGDVVEGFRDGHRGDQHRDHHREQDWAGHPLVGLHPVAKPGIAAPAPPQDGQQEHPAKHAASGRIVRHQLRHLGDGVDEDETEEQFEGSDPRALAQHSRVRRPRRGHGEILPPAEPSTGDVPQWANAVYLPSSDLLLT